jgi:hypothetical protein
MGYRHYSYWLKVWFVWGVMGLHIVFFRCLLLVLDGMLSVSRRVELLTQIDAVNQIPFDIRIDP